MRTRRVVPLLVALLATPLLPAGPAAAAHPIWSGCEGDRARLIAAVQTKGGPRTELTSLDSACTMIIRGTVSDPEVAADGRTIVGAAIVNYDQQALFLIDDEYHRFQQLTSPPSSSEGASPDADLAPTFSPDGTQVLFVRRPLKTSIPSALYVVDVPPYNRPNSFSSPPAPIPTPRKIPNTDGARSAAWSPDGSRIVFSIDGPEASSEFWNVRDGQLVSIRPDGTDRQDLGVRGQQPTFSPDGETLAFTQYDLSKRHFGPPPRALALAPATGGAVTVLPATLDGFDVSSSTWWPNGQSLVIDARPLGLDAQRGTNSLFAVDRSGARIGQYREGEAYSPHITPARSNPTSEPKAEAGEPSGFTAITPRRVLDTRVASGGGRGTAVGPGGTVDATVTGTGVPTDASAVALTVTAVQASDSTDVRVYPAGSPSPNASNLNLTTGQTVPNAVVVPVGPDGKVTLANSGGRVHLLVDVAGYYKPDTGAGFASTAPHRILDTRTGVGAPTAKVGPAGTLDLQVTGELQDADGGTVKVPADATAVVLNLTGTGPTDTTDVRAYPRPAGDGVPVVSNLNLRRGQTAASLATVAVGANGQVRLRNAGGEVDLIADLAGWYAPSAPGRFVPARPLRLLDTRTGDGAARLPTRAEEAVELTLAGRYGIPATATAALLNVTGTGVSQSTDVRAYPADAAKVPTVSNLNLAAGSTRANLAVAPLGGDPGAVRLRNNAGSVSLVADLAGWFVTP